jgi:hypothetical protein
MARYPVMKPHFFIALFTVAAASAIATEPAKTTWSFGTGYRQDQLRWTIAGDLNGTSPNILSDLNWTDVGLVPFSLEADVALANSWRIHLGATYATGVSGSVQDSDYDRNNRQGEFSRSYADASGSSAFDAAVAFGRDFTASPSVTLTPWVGLSIHQQNLSMQNGVQAIDTEDGALGAFSGLDSSYDASWQGIMLGMDAKIRTGEKSRLLLGARYEFAQYEAKGHWNLRSDLQGFTHSSNGGGIHLNAGWERDFGNQWTAGAYVDWLSFEANAGEDFSRTSEGNVTTRLNGVSWESLTFGVKVSKRF